MSVEDTLKERGARYGEFKGHADVTQKLKAALHSHPSWSTMPSTVRESLEMIAHKMGRIVNGDPLYKDSWVDIAGYAELIARDLE